MADQTVATQLRRLKSGRCPIHGCGFGQATNYWYDINGVEIGEGAKFCIAECPRQGCDVRVTATGRDVGKLIAPAKLAERLEIRRPRE